VIQIYISKAAVDGDMIKRNCERAMQWVHNRLLEISRRATPVPYE
jgi:hypothetical protein